MANEYSAASQSRTEKLLAELIEKIDILIRVTSIQVGADKSITERAWLLKVAGLDNQTIAAVLNISPATVRTLTANFGPVDTVPLSSLAGLARRR